MGDGIKELPDGRWEYRYRGNTEKTPKGEYVAHRERFPTEWEARQRKDEVQRLKKQKLPVVPLKEKPDSTGQTVSELASAYIATKTARPKTVEVDQGLIDLLIDPLIGNAVVVRLTKARVRDFVSAATAKADAGDTTRGQVHKAAKLLRRMLDLAVLRGVREDNPADIIRVKGVLPKIPRKPPVRAIAPEGVEKLRAYMIKRSPDLGLRDATITSLMAYGGLRPGEVRGLRWTDLDGNRLTIEQRLDDDRIEISTKDNMSSDRSAADRKVTLWAPLVEDLEKWREACGSPTTGLMFANAVGLPMGASDWRNYNRRAVKLSIAKALPDWTGKRDDPYILRHSNASLRIRSGQDLQSVATILGHSLAALMGTYSHEVREYRADGETIDPVQKIREARGETYASEAPPTDEELEWIYARRREQEYDDAVVVESEDGPTVTIADLR